MRKFEKKSAQVPRPKEPLVLPPFQETQRTTEIDAYLKREVYTLTQPIELTKATQFKSSPIELIRGIVSLYQQLETSDFARAAMGNGYFLEASGKTQLSGQLFLGTQKHLSSFVVDKKELLASRTNEWQQFKRTLQRKLKTTHPLLAELWSAQIADLEVLNSWMNNTPQPVYQGKNILNLLQSIHPLPTLPILKQLEHHNDFACYGIQPDQSLPFSQQKMVWIMQAKQRAQDAMLFMVKNKRLLIVTHLSNQPAIFEDTLDTPHALKTRLSFFWKHWHSFDDGLALEYGECFPTQTPDKPKTLKRKNEPYLLKSTDGPERIEIKANTNLLVGRGASCDIVIANPSIGKKQARFIFKDGICSVEDAESPSGTYLNGKQLRTATTIKRGDQIRLGGLTFQVE